VGPIESYEEFVPRSVQQTGYCGGTQVGQVSTRVTLQMETMPTPVRRTTWGQLKLVYR
jgi:hypothetical protein